MKRRNFLGATIATGLAMPFYSFTRKHNIEPKPEIRDVFSINKNLVHIYTKANIKPIRIFHITDTHLAIEDEREAPFKKYSKRMGNAYKINTHFESGHDITYTQSFEQTLQKAKEKQANFLALTGDIFSFPSEAAVEWAFRKLRETEIPFGYIAGNHDWHYEGMPGSSFQLREKWANERLKPLYQGNNYLFASYDIGGVRMVFIDNSTYEIAPEQLEFFKQQLESGIPMILYLHIPLYLPGRGLDYGCAHPQWGNQTDEGFETEKREKWRNGGHTPTTFGFCNQVFNAQNLLAVFAGHTHHSALDVRNNIPQIVSAHNATGYYTEINIAKTS